MIRYPVFSFTTAADALAEIRRQHEAGEPLVWNGPDHLHHVISAGCPEPSWLFSAEGLASAEEQGRDFWDTYTMVAFQLGYHAGTVKEEENTEFWKTIADRERHITKLLDKAREPEVKSAMCTCGEPMAMHFDSRDTILPPGAITSHPGTLKE